MREYDRAISDYNKAIELDPKLAGAYSNRGYVYVHKQDKNHAIADFRKALSLDPNHNGAREGLRRFGLTN
jgi:tetratricopeptide (TPR) repeat protein